MSEAGRLAPYLTNGMSYSAGVVVKVERKRIIVRDWKK